MSYISDLRKKVGHDAIFMPCSACIIVKNNKILLQKRTDDGLWALHGGSLELGESFQDALFRELKEEINIEPINPILKKVFSGRELFHIYPNGDKVYVIVAVFVVHDYIGVIKVDQVEVSEVCWFDLTNLPNELLNTDKEIIYQMLVDLKNE